MKKAFLAYSILLIVFCGCGGQDVSKHPQSSAYFDSKKYFDQEAVRLGRKNASIKKTVVVDGLSETKSISIPDWKKELSAFTDAEITRASWKGLFIIRKTPKVTTYSSTEDKIPVKEFKVISRNGKVKGLSIIVKNDNMLYQSADSLVYYPDSMYQIIKHQNIRFLSNKTYTVTGVFK